jgi:signal transduction histidine kinase
VRSPLTNIIGFAQLLSDERVGLLNDKQRDYAGYIMSSSATLLAIVNDILDLSSIDAGIMNLDLAEVDVAAALALAVDSVSDRLREGRVTLDVDVSPEAGRMIADEKRLRQIVHNLLSNAIQFSPEGGRIRLMARRDRDSIEIVVTDSGAGIPGDFVGSVFDRFAAMSRGGSRGGVGLGLSIVKSLVGLHGGTVEIASEEGIGTTARVRLPVRPALDAAAAE